MKETVLVTGAAGFIGSHLVERLLKLGYGVIGLDNFDSYYDPAIKRENVRAFAGRCRVIVGDIRDSDLIRHIFAENDITRVAHLAARAGVRPSLQYPLLYQDVNIGGTITMMEAASTRGVEQFVYASSSSVYGLNARVPFSESDKVDYPASPYAASKAAAELFCRSYNHLCGLPVKALRFFTVYGPRQRPEMAIHLFTRMIETGRAIPFFGDGSSQRDYTYIDDIIDGVVAALVSPDRSFEIYNLGNSYPVSLDYLIRALEKATGKEAALERLPMQPGDVPITCADISKAGKDLGYRPKTTIEEGIGKFLQWYRAPVPTL